MKVDLLLTCLCDAIYGEVGVATVRALEHVGCLVQFKQEQTCCGQPPFNAGDWDAAKPIANRTIEIFKLNTKDGLPVVTPSASCAAMMRHGYGMLEVQSNTNRVYELCEFIVDILKIDKWPGKVKPKTVALHRACHSRMLGMKNQQESLIASIDGVTLVEIDDSEQCCGFGGAFSMTHGKTSEGIGLEKLRKLQMTGADVILSGDMGCVAHLDGLAKRNGINIEFRHIAQLLAEAVQN